MKYRQRVDVFAEGIDTIFVAYSHAPSELNCNIRDEERAGPCVMRRLKRQREESRIKKGGFWTKEFKNHLELKAE